MTQLKQRYLFIDLLRFVAGFFMIQGHVFDALLSPQVKSASWYYVHDFFHGFIAPMFLFASGVAFGVATIRSWEHHIVWGERVRRRAWKFLALMAIGYALHLPYFSLWKTITAATSMETKSMVQVDALQCIGFTLLILQCAVILLRKKELFVRVVALGAAIVIFGSPVMWSLHFGDKAPLWMTAYFNAENGSWFPLFPWSAYILCGVLFGYCFLKMGNYRAEAAAVLKYAAVAAGTAVLALLALRLPFNFYPPHDFWKSDPSIILVRLSVVSMVAAGIYLAERYIQTPSRIPSILGRESLFVYIVHLLIVYGSVMGPGLSYFIGPTLSLIQTLFVTVLVFVVVMFLAVLWYGLNSNHRTVADRLKFAGAAIFLLAFIIRPW
jgi:Heparan-alpha-glucosaminide N-acetyltransferase, catalytic